MQPKKSRNAFLHVFFFALAVGCGNENSESANGNFDDSDGSSDGSAGSETEGDDIARMDGSDEISRAPVTSASVHGTMTVTSGTLIVNQNLVTQIPSHSGSGWWFCGQAAMASAINLLRGSVTPAAKITQLEWYHQQLLGTPIAGYPYTYQNHYQANIDALRMITDAHPDFVVPAKVWTTSRSTARDSMKTALDNGYLVVALGEISVGGVVYGHYKTVYKIEHLPALPTGGTVYLADPYTGLPKQEAFSTFLDGVGADGSYSFIKVKLQ